MKKIMISIMAVCVILSMYIAKVQASEYPIIWEEVGCINNASGETLVSYKDSTKEVNMDVTFTHDGKSRQIQSVVFQGPVLLLHMMVRLYGPTLQKNFDNNINKETRRLTYRRRDER